MKKKKAELLSAAGSHPGCERQNNEDRFLNEPDRGIFIVIDGVGGHVAGDVAADIARDVIGARLRRLTGSAAERLHEAITLANNKIYKCAQGREDRHGMACVLTAAVVEDGRATIGHVGDTRLYKLSGGQLRKVTHDHSPVGEREDAGELSEAEAMRHPHRNEVYRDVGTELHEPDDKDFIELIEIPFEPDSALLMCSDGLSDMLTSSRMMRLIEERAPDPAEIVKRLIDAANEAGGRDNITVIFAAGRDFAARERTNGQHPLHAGEVTTRALNAARTLAVKGEEDAARTELRGRRAHEWLDALRWNLLHSRLTALIGGALLCMILLVLLPDGMKRNWLVAGGPARDAARPARRLLVGSGRGAEAQSIGEALSQARPGDTVEVAPGEYREQLEMKEGVTLVSIEPQGAVILAPAGDGPRVAVMARGVAAGRLVGFRIAGDEARPLDVGLRIEDSNVEVERTEVTGAASAGVEVSGASAPTLSSNRIRANAGAGLVVGGEARPRVINNVFEGNGGQAGAGARDVEVRAGAAPLLTDNVFIGGGGEGVAGLDGERLAEIKVQNFFVGRADGAAEVERADTARADNVRNEGSAQSSRARPRRSQSRRQRPKPVEMAPTAESANSGGAQEGP